MIMKTRMTLLSSNINHDVNGDPTTQIATAHEVHSCSIQNMTWSKPNPLCLKTVMTEICSHTNDFIVDGNSMGGFSPASSNTSSSDSNNSSIVEEITKNEPGQMGAQKGMQSSVSVLTTMHTQPPPQVEHPRVKSALVASPVNLIKESSCHFLESELR